MRRRNKLMMASLAVWGLSLSMVGASDRDMISLRAYEESVGHKVIWNKLDQEVQVYSDQEVLYTLTLGEDHINFGGMEISLESPLQVKEGQTQITRELLSILHGEKPQEVGDSYIVNVGYLSELDGNQNTFVLSSYASLEDFCRTYTNQTYDGEDVVGDTSKVLTKLYNEDYFEENSLAIAYVPSTYGQNHFIDVQAIQDGDRAILQYTLEPSEGGTAVMGGDFVVYEVEKDIKTIEVVESNNKFNFDFKESNQGFEGIFADYHDDSNNFESYEMQWSYKEIPVENEESNGLYIASTNRSDDIFMGFVKELTGLEKNQTYTFDIEFKMATNVAGGMMGVGGSPAESVYVKTGIVTEKPIIAEDETGVFRFMNVDTGSQSQGGKDLVVVGNMAKPEGDFTEAFAFKTLQANVTAQSNEEGKVYLMIGTDSGFEGFSEYYIDDVVVSYH